MDTKVTIISNLFETAHNCLFESAYAMNAVREFGFQISLLPIKIECGTMNRGYISCIDLVKFIARNFDINVSSSSDGEEWKNSLVRAINAILEAEEE